MVHILHNAFEPSTCFEFQRIDRTTPTTIRHSKMPCSFLSTSPSPSSSPSIPLTHFLYKLLDHEPVITLSVSAHILLLFHSMYSNWRFFSWPFIQLIVINKQKCQEQSERKKEVSLMYIKYPQPAPNTRHFQ